MPRPVAPTAIPPRLPSLTFRLLAAQFLLALGAPAQSVFWDTNGSTAGSSATTTATGTWDASNTFWNASSDGTGGTAAWQAGDSAEFSAGTNATGTYTVTVSGTQTVGALSFNLGDVTLTGSTLLSDTAPFTVTAASGASGTINSVVSGDDGLTKAGSGTLTLGGTNTYSGTTTVNAGTLALTDESNLGTGAVTVNAGGTLTISSNFNDPLSRDVTIDGAGATLSGDGHLWFNRTSATTTNITITDGGALSAATSISLADSSSSTNTLNVSGTDSTLTAGTVLFLGYLGDATATVSAGGTISTATLDLASQSGGSATLNLNDGGTLVVSGGTNAIFSGSGTTSFNLGGGTLQVSGSDLTTSVPMNLVAATDSTIDTNSLNATLSGVLSGDGALSKSGDGTLTLASTNTYAGGTTVDGGTLSVTRAAQLGSGDITIQAGGTLNASGDLEFNTDRSVTVDGTAARLEADTHLWFGTANGADTLTSIGAGATVSTGTTFSLADVTGSTSSLTVSGVDALLDAIGNLYVGYAGDATATVSDGGTIKTDAVFSIATTGGTSTFNLNDGGTLQVGGTDGIAIGTGSGTFNFGGGTLQVIGSNLTTSVPFALTSATTSTVDTNSFDATLNGALAGAGALAKSGTGTLTLTAANTYSGGTTVQAGTLAITDSAGLGATTGALTLNGGTLDLGGFAITAAGVTVNDGTLTNGSVTSTADYTVAAGTLSTPLGGSVALTKTGSGTAILAADNTYTGTTTISAGTLQLGNGGSTGSIASSAIVNNGTLALNRSADLDLTANLSGTGNVSQDGTGTTTLSGTNSYTGTTTLNAGTLVLGNASVMGPSNGTTVLNGGTLDLGGFTPYRANLVFNGGTTTNGSLANVSAYELQTGSLSDPLLYDRVVTKTGSGTFTLSGDGNVTNDIRINGGTLVFDGADATTTAWRLLPGHTADGSAILSGGADVSTTSNIRVGDFAGVTGVLTVDGAGTTLTPAGLIDVGFNGTGTLNVTAGAVVDSGWYVRFGVNAGSAGTGLVTGSGSQLSATSSLDLGTYGQGELTIADGGTVIANDGLHFGSLGGTGTLNLNDGGTLVVGSSYGIRNSGTANFNFAGGTLQTTGNALTSSVPVVLTNDSTLHTPDFSAVLSGTLSGTGTLTKTGNATLTLSGANTFEGATTVSGGALIITSDANLGTAPDSATPGHLTLDAGSLLTNGTFTLDANRGIALGSGGAVISPNSGTITYDGIIAGSGALTKTGDGTLVLTNANTYTGNTSIAAGTVQLGDGGTTGSLASATITLDGGTLAYVRSDDFTLNTGYTGTGNLTQAGANVITLGTAQSYTGTTNINAGTLRLGAANQLADAGSVNVGAAGTWDLDGHDETIANLSGSGAVTLGSADLTTGSATAATFSGSIGGTGNLIKAGSGTLTLSGSSSFTGSTTINAGTLAVTSDAALGTAPVSATPGHLTLDGTSLATSGTFSLDANRGIALGTGGGTLDVTSGTLSYAGVIAGSGALAKSGTGDLVLTGTNTHTGGTTVTGGLVEFDALAAFGTGNVTLNGGGLRWATGSTLDVSSRLNGLGAGGGTFDTNANDLTFTTDLSGAGRFTKQGAGTFTLSANTGSFATVAINGGALDLANGAGLTTSSWISFADASGSTGNGAVTGSDLDVGGALYVGYAGATTFTIGSGGTVSAAQLRLADTAAGDATFNLNSGGTLRLSGDEAIVAGSGTTALNFAGGTLQLNGSGFTAYVPATLTGTTTFDSNGYSGGYYGALTGDGGALKAGAGVFTITNANTYTGGTTVNGGTLIVNTATDLGTGSVTVNTGAALAAATHLEFRTDVTADGADAVITSPNHFEVGSAGDGSLTLTDGALAGSGTTTTLAYYGGDTGTVSVTGTGSTLYAQTALRVGYGGTGTLAIGSGGTVNADSLTLGSQSGSAGTLNLNAGGTLQVGGTDGIAIGAGTGAFNLAGGTLKVGGDDRVAAAPAVESIDVTDLPNVFAGVIAANTPQGGDTGLTTSVDMTLSNASTIDTNGSAATLAGELSGTGSFTKSGAGTLTLTGANTYSGDTTISAGTLLIGNGSGSAFGSGDVTVASGATLGGTGSFTGSLTVASGGTLAPGNSPGLLSLDGDLTLMGILQMELGGSSSRGTDFDALDVGGTLTLGGTLEITFYDSYVPTGATSWDLFDATSLGGTFAAYELPTVNGYTWDTSALGSTGTLSLNVSAVPEPSTTAVLAGLAMLGYAFHRRRRGRGRALS